MLPAACPGLVKALLRYWRGVRSGCLGFFQELGECVGPVVLRPVPGAGPEMDRWVRNSAAISAARDN